MTAEIHRQHLNQLVEEHFDQAKSRVSDVYQQYFISASRVFSRHWRHKRDVPQELATLPRTVWKALKKCFKKRHKNSATEPVFLSAKQTELETIITDELLDLAGLDNKIKEYVIEFQDEFDTELQQLFADLSAQQEEEMTRQLADYVKEMGVPVEGAREALVFMLTGLLGKSLGAASFGSSVAVGQAAASAMYMSHASWWAGFWASLTGVPAWVGVAGAGGGILAMLLIAPILAPFVELGINRLNGEKKLYALVEQARSQMIRPETDTLDVLGQLAIYLQLLPDILLFLRKIKP